MYLRPLVLAVIACALLTAGHAKAQIPELDVQCTASPTDDWPDQMSRLDDRVLCRVEGYDIRIEMTGINIRLGIFISDTSDIFNTYRRYQNNYDFPQPVTLNSEDFSENVVEFYLRDGNGSRIMTLHRHFVWTRDLTLRLNHNLGGTSVVYGASQSFRCGYRQVEVDGVVGPLGTCIAARTVVLCDSWHFNPHSGTRFVRFPVLTVRSNGPDASRAMMEGFDQIAQVLEGMQTEILTRSCAGR